MNRRYQTLADYVAIGLAPLLIFWMLNSLAGFLMLVLYQGNYPQRVMWTLFWYTMGATALARVTIEESRSYSSVYATALGAATFFVMLRFLGDPIFSAAVIMTIGYLADRIVHDCTIVDDGVDSSGQGLVDSARKWFERLRSPRDNQASPPQTKTDAPKKQIGLQGHQPGRTVLYLALGALPLFGIGQFFLRDNPGSWDSARWQLASYLFASLSLLVVTSFLNLRRYLRQRNTEMPGQVTAAWLLGGIGLILLVLMLAILAPLPGQAIVSFQMPDFLTSSNPTSASRFGWGDEGADQPGEGGEAKAAPRPDAKTPSDAPESATRTQAGAPPGGDSGKRDDGPVGKESGGKKASEKSNDESGKTKSDGSQPKDNGDGKKSDGQKPNTENNGSKSPDAKPPENQAPKSEPSAPQSPDRPNPDNNQSPKRDPPPSGESDSQQNQPDQTEQSQPESGEQDERSSEQNDDTSSDANDKKPESQEAPPNQSPAENSPPPSDESAESPSQAPAPEPASSTDWSGLLAGFTGLMKFLIIAALFAIVAVYVYLNRDALMAWFNNLFGASDSTTGTTPTRAPTKEPPQPRRPFSSFENPVGNADAGQVVVLTFQALEAWGREQGVSRTEDETPSEYTRRLVSQFPNLQQSAIRVVDAYNRVVYGRAMAGRDDVTAASSVWQIMRPQL
ncbi:hypothetical protein FHS27_002432 [Rhodopirellula rubra]|uniref:Protein-glutamine gamma-glutamyltransferase-like C-terminal domain-containing protein n=1 Tax=Aporhodopirellula rubra TaxID=980271 RepID=A0A7W5H647_9BACT|nr:DUF4129 domain-containing protein [Aporhodopirellula rubra]MBB3206620.1 hypothetical protein [Aporhodopirellula rubra]